ncbi:ribulose-phosphate 3-epimerase [Caloramator sp. E03]|uniref:D-allulose 6-phosphate 3-epimerase n=1 Tax=Caloramator sp. E03 TaxID=2576307 RepID=UPI0011107039|nr:D-allulose 6-phosphate 3-epimerase [Caloramator sp. E03]QCX34028.1 ribulose-phosphate 3-epimerase [Caloramator sp. E03]
MDCKFSPSLMCMNLLELKNQIDILNERADFYHIDIMDGHYVNNITLSPYFIKQIRSIAKLPIDAHLMVEKPESIINDAAKAGADYITPHAETIDRQAFRIIKKIKDLGCRAGIALNPATSIESIKYYLHLLDKITIMTVDPGFAGQPFIPEMLKKIEQLKEIKQKNGYKYLIEVDGACNFKTFSELFKAGAEVFILGTSGLFGLDDNLEKAWDIMIDNFSYQIKNIQKIESVS